MIDQTTLRVALEAVDPGLRRYEVLAASGLPIVVPAKAGTQRLLLNVGTFGLNSLALCHRRDLMSASGGIQYRCLYDERCLSHSAKAAPVSTCCSPISTEACK